MAQVKGQDTSTVVQLVDELIHDAIDASASDIHLESTEKGLRLRYRIDGVLYDQKVFGLDVMPQIISRLKVLAQIDIAQKRIPQDGKFRIINGKEKVDLRISTFPSIYGEKVVIRILDRSVNTIALDQLGFTSQMLEAFGKLISKSSGFVLVTGPTGSGKTTTLYAALAQLNREDCNIMTLEDPVEYHVDGIVQGQIHCGAGFTFAKGIRALLRQDPDIALIGEIRDQESARIAIEAALTGHQVFSTLHTTDAPGAIMRLMDMGIAPFLINAALTGVLAQRLVRTICVQCKYESTPSEQEQVLLDRYNIDVKRLFKGRGCNVCQRLGYKGRTGIFQLLIMTSFLRALIIRHPIFDDIHTQACSDGMQLLLDDGCTKLKQGIISLEELMRVVA